MRRPTLAAGALLAAALAGAGVGAATYAGVSSTDTVTTVVRESSAGGGAAPAVAMGDQLTVNQAYRRAAAGVVEITASSSGEGAAPFPSDGDQPRQEAQGSGFVYDDAGHVVTNQHVVAGATSLEVTFPDGSSHSARVVGTDPSTDIAVLEVDAPASELEPLTLGDSADLEVGDGVVAIGSPFGLEETVTSGIVSALNRNITAPNGFGINGAIQTDAAINHGNSGGPLLDLSGQVVGVNAQIESESGGNDGVGFAIPSSTVRAVVTQILEDGKVEHAYLGVSLAQAGQQEGARVGDVRSGSPAERAGLRANDVITAVDGKRVAEAPDVQAAIDAKSPGDTVTITYSRGGQSDTVEVELGNRPSS